MSYCSRKEYEFMRKYKKCSATSYEKHESQCTGHIASVCIRVYDYLKNRENNTIQKIKKLFGREG